MTPGSGLSPNLHHLETSATIAISQEAKRRKAAGEDVIDLGAGEPDFPTPALPSDAGVRAIREGKTHYRRTKGSWSCAPPRRSTCRCSRAAAP